MNWKMIYLARRNPSLAPEQFSQAWREHSALGAGCTNVRAKVLSVAQCSRVLTPPTLPGTDTGYDGVNLLALRDLQGAIDIWNDPETLAIMRPDEPRVFSTYVRHFSLVCEEQVLRDAPRTGVALVGFVAAEGGVADLPSAPEVCTPLPTVAQPKPWMLSGPLAQARRVVHNAVCLMPPPGYVYDSICEWWFDDEAALRAAFAGVTDLRESLPQAQTEAAELARAVFMFTRITHQRP